MKKIIAAIILSILGIQAYATLNGAGFYRLQNYGSQRWANVVDNKGSANLNTGSADLHALELLNNTNGEIYSDPGSILYITPVSGSQYDFAVQGTTLHSMVGHQINVKANGSANGQTLYQIYGTKDGATKYISDLRPASTTKEGVATINSSVPPNNNKWLFQPVNTTTNYFGAVPTVTSQNKNYGIMFASFAYKPYSSGVKIYYISRVNHNNGQVEMLEATNGVPGGVPAIILCSGATAASNKLQPLTSNPSISSNVLTGVYFDYTGSTNVNQVAYDPNTMRVLGTCSDGSLGFVTSYSLKYIPSNTAYLKVPAGSPSQYKCVNASVFTAGVDSLVDDEKEGSLTFDGHNLISGGNIEVRIFNMSGQMLMNSNEATIDVTSLPKGIYVATTGKKSLKFIR